MLIEEYDLEVTSVPREPGSDTLAAIVHLVEDISRVLPYLNRTEDRSHAQKVARGLVDLVSRTWERREEVEPDHEMHQRPGPLEVYKLLPQTSCKDCGQPTCYTFALKLVMGHVWLEDCPALREPRYEQHWAQLDALLPSDIPAIGSQA